MICYLVRHGRDDESVRGGWSDQPLTKEGEMQAADLAVYLRAHKETMDIRYLYSSDLPRAVQTTQPLAESLNLPMTLLPAFREVNNGVLAGMDNELAMRQYPGLFWNTLAWDERYPGGESPQEFCARITEAWDDFTARIAADDENALLVTHSGVIRMILCLLEGRQYSNKEKHRRVPHAGLIALEYKSGAWQELQSE